MDTRQSSTSRSRRRLDEPTAWVRCNPFDDFNLIIRYDRCRKLFTDGAMRILEDLRAEFICGVCACSAGPFWKRPEPMTEEKWQEERVKCGDDPERLKLWRWAYMDWKRENA